MSIKNIIFDLGGVILEIDYALTAKAFEQLGANHFEAFFRRDQQNQVIDDYEISKIDNTAFRNAIRSQFNIQVDDATFDKAWNAMLLTIPPERLTFLKVLGSKYRLFLFSNTNDIHLKMLLGKWKLENYFEKVYYSNQFKLRKPDPDAFLKIVRDNRLDLHETLFVDDTIRHIQAAKQLGLKTLHLTKDKNILSIENYINTLN